MKQKAIRRWYLFHKWTSLICTLFMLLLCVTGLPLIFSDEIDALTSPAMASAPAGPPAALDAIVAKARKLHPGHAILYVTRDDEAPIVYVTSAPRPDSPDNAMAIDPFDARTGRRLDQPPANSGVMFFILRLHESLLLDLPGELFLALMGSLLFTSLVSGAVVYAPFMRKLAFSSVRKDRSRRVLWLDTHNMIGIVTLVWFSVVGLTGMINCLSTPIVALWKTNELARMIAAYRDAPPPARMGSVDAAVRTARSAAPGMELSFVAYPGTDYSSQHHYAVFMKGATPLTKQLMKPALIDVQTGRLTAISDMPLYAKVLFLSQPLHYGDYGGLPLKIIWALLDIAAIVVLATGLYLWIGRRRVPLEKRLAELSSGATSEVPA
ncbi:MAG: PepSY domain-containing protein [Novosphingobium sp.]